MVWYDTFGDTFWLAVLAATVGACGLSVKYSVRAKCTQCSLCFGLLRVGRDTHAELTEDLRLIDRRGGGPSPEFSGKSDEYTLTNTPQPSAAGDPASSPRMSRMMRNAV
jgi:hypothetical protein